MQRSLSRVVFVLIAASAAVPDGNAVADVLARESFDYPAGSALAGQSGGSGWHGPWAAPSGAARVAAYGSEVSRTGWFARFSSAGYSACFGSHAVVDGNTRIVRLLDVGSGGPLDKAGLVDRGRIGRDGTTLYVGFLQRISRVPVAGPGSTDYLRFYAVEFNTGGADTTRVLEIGHDDRAGAPFYGAASVVNHADAADREPGQLRPLGEQDTCTNMIVVKFTFGPGDRDTAEVFRNPESLTDESASTVDAKLTGHFEFDRIAIARFVGKSPVHEVDEIRVATDYREVFTPVDPERIKAALAQATEQVRRQVEARRQKIDALAARGIDVTAWRSALDRIASAPGGTSPWERLDRLERLALSMGLADVDLGVEKLLFVKRHAYRPTHIYTEFSDGPYRPGGGIFVLSPVCPDGKVTRLFDAKGGICRDPDISFDGRRVLFSYRPSEKGYYHVYEMNVDGSGLRQLTDGPFHDLDPFYLPDGRIGLTSTRCKSRALCFWVRAATLFVMDADGGNCRPLSANNVNEFTPEVLPDGSILYTRWEYMDKSAIFVQSLWSILPDGTRARQVFGNNLIHPVSMLQARLIPGTRKIACILTAHNGNSYGPLAVIDPARGVNNPGAILNLVPEVGYDSGCFAPYPLDDRWCIVSYGPAEPFGLYLFGIDPPAKTIRPGKTKFELQSPQFPTDLGRYWRSAAGPRHLIYRDDAYSCVEAIPVAPRPKPPVVASGLRSAGDENHENHEKAPEPGTLVLADVYQGLAGAVPRGTIKHLRVVEEMGHRDEHGRRNYTGAFDQADFSRTYKTGFMSLYASPWESGRPAPSLQAKWIFGTVPVEADGSAHFTVPAGRPVYFSALDKDYGEVQRMRSYIHLMPGERLSCIGCHEPRHTAPAASAGAPPLALRHAPHAIQAPPWGAGPFSYQKLVQPILDRRCVECHGPDKPAGGVDLSARRDGRGVPASFATLVRPRTDPNRPPLVHFFDSWWGTSTTVPVARPLSFGAAASRLVEVIDDGHAGFTMTEQQRDALRLSPEERRVITTWIDLNCPLWDSYSPAQHARRD